MSENEGAIATEVVKDNVSLMQNIPEAPNGATLTELQKKLTEHQLLAAGVVLKHHTKAYSFAAWMLFWLLFLVYVPMTLVVLMILRDIICLGNGTDVITALTAFVKGGGGTVLIVLFVAPIVILLGMLRHSNVGSQAQGNDVSEISSLVSNVNG